MEDNTVISFKKDEKERFLSFLGKYKNFIVHDLYEELWVEYKVINNPQYYFNTIAKKQIIRKKLKDSLDKKKLFSKGTWIVVPSQKEIYHLLNKIDYLDFRTIRNRDLINSEEQKVLYYKKILFIGMSVGSQVLSCFIRTGIGNEITIVDADEVEIHNLNRTNFFIQDLGRKKIEVVKKQILSIDPYINVKTIEEYLSNSNLNNIIKKVDLIVDSFDNFEMKIKLRKLAKKLRVPVLSGFDISKGAMVIVERYDIDRNLDLKFYLNGYAEEDILNLKEKSLNEKTKIFINVIGKEHHDKRMLESALSVGKKLTGYPQLSIATNLTSALWTSVAVDILLGKMRESIREYINLENFLYK